jgi:hypothetical protein
MPVYHFTFHAYRSWNPDHPRGYTKKGIGYLPPDPEMTKRYNRNAKQPPVLFDCELQKEILSLTYVTCEEEGWRLEAAGFDPTHAHLMVSWVRFIPWEEVDRRLKNLLALKLNRRHHSPGKRWFVRRHGAPRRVRDKQHFTYLAEIYFPDHRGAFWKRGMMPPDVR